MIPGIVAGGMRRGIVDPYEANVIALLEAGKGAVDQSSYLRPVNVNGAVAVGSDGSNPALVFTGGHLHLGNPQDFQTGVESFTAEIVFRLDLARFYSLNLDSNVLFHCNCYSGSSSGYVLSLRRAGPIGLTIDLSQLTSYGQPLLASGFLTADSFSNQYSRIAIIRSGNDWQINLNGNTVASGSWNRNISVGASQQFFRIGDMNFWSTGCGSAIDTGASGRYQFPGWVRRFRFTRSVARSVNELLPIN